jgi:hypothetical protein
MNTFPPKFASLAVLVLATIGHDQSSGRQAASGQGPSTVRAEGCVWEGVDPTCLVVTDDETGTVYNVFFAGDKPAIGQRIFFTATLRGGPNACLQGRPVDVQRWVKRKLKCEAPKPKRNPY